MHGGTSRSTEDDDPIVQEIPIMLSKRLDDQLFIFQYPLQPRSRNNFNVRKCLIKTQNQEVKLEVDINIESEGFDAAKAEEIAKKINSFPQSWKENKEVVFENNLMDKVIYESVRSVKACDKYALGVFNGKEYHITPLQGFFQLRPNYDYLDNASKSNRADNESELLNHEDVASSQAQQITVRFARSNNRSQKNKESSYRSLMQKSSEEPWVECNWEKANSSISELEKMKLFAENVTDTGQIKQLNSEEYVKQLVPEDREKIVIKPSLPANVLSLNDLRSLPIAEQCKLLLRDAKIVQLKQLSLLLASCEGLTVDSLLKALPQVAVLVRGNWIIKSNILYPPDTYSGVNGVPSDQMCRARDYVLYMFTKNQYLDRRKISSIIKLPNEEVKEIFTSISKLRLNKGWELLLPLDYDFIHKHSDIVQRQEIMWEQRFKQLIEFVKDEKEKKQRRKSKSISEDKKMTKRERLISSSKEGDSESGEEKKMATPMVSKGKKMSLGDSKSKRKKKNRNSESSKEDSS